jgi:hypothetical protein
MRPLVCLLVMIASSTVFAGPKRLNTFADFFSALKQGKTVRIVIEYAKTTLKIDGKEEKAPDATGGFEINGWEQFAKGVV